MNHFDEWVGLNNSVVYQVSDMLVWVSSSLFAMITKKLESGQERLKIDCDRLIGWLVGWSTMLVVQVKPAKVGSTG